MKNSEKNFKIARMIAICLMVVYYISILISELQTIMEVPMVHILLLWLVCIVAIPITWLVCIIFYWDIEFGRQKDNQKSKRRYALSIVFMAVSGSLAFENVVDIGEYIAYNRNLLDDIWKYVIFYCMMAVVWIICLICRIKYREKIQTKGMAKRWILVVSTIGMLLLVVFTYVSELYVEEKTEEIFWERSIEHDEAFEDIDCKGYEGAKT